MPYEYERRGTQRERPVGGAQVLAFATGCPRLPAVGGTAPNFVISINHHAVRSTCTGHCECRSSGTRRLALTRAPMLLQPLEELPTSSTCTSTLNLPPYVTEELTLERLRLVINVGLTGFGRM